MQSGMMAAITPLPIGAKPGVMPIDHIHRQRIYLDHNATAPLRPEAREAIIRALDVVGNPSSVHAEGRAAKALVEDAREAIAKLVGAEGADITFTSGATEANNWVMRAGWDTIVYAAIEHDSLLGPIERSSARLVKLPVEGTGEAYLGAVADYVLLGNRPLGRDLVTLQLANSETGVIQDVATVADFCAAHGVFSHTDAVQAPGRIPVAFHDLGVDAMTISSHKLGGPAGVGALITKSGLALPPALLGGGQEMRRRAGTENVAAIAGFGAAARSAFSDLATIDRIRRKRDLLEDAIREKTPQAIILGQGVDRLPNTTCVSLPGGKAETMVIKFDLAGIAVSAGSACSSGKVATSPVLAAMGVAPEVAGGAIRVSLGWTSSEIDLEPFLTTWMKMAGTA
ncbi:MAG: cysteine desulfurase family protein [Pseudomonadota bacterium]